MKKVRIVRADERHRCNIDHLIHSTHIGDGMSGLVRGFWCAKVGNRIVGCGGINFINQDTAVLTHIAVEKEFRRQGIGTALISRCLDYARDMKVRHIALITMYYLFRRFKKHGFRVVRRATLTEPLSSYPDFTSKRYMKCAVMRRDT